MSTAKVINLQHPTASTTNIALDNSGNASVGNNLSVAGNSTVTGNETISGNLLFNSGYGSAATAYGCRAWVNFNGTGTVAIRADGGVSSITDGGTGTYTVNFDVTLPDSNFAGVCTTESVSAGSNISPVSTRTTTSFSVLTLTTGGGLADSPGVYVAIFR